MNQLETIEEDLVFDEAIMAELGVDSNLVEAGGIDLNELALTRDLKRALARQADIKRFNGLAAYEPHAKQILFHAAGAKKRRYVRTGNRFGKSLCNAAELISWCIGERIFFDEGDPRRYVGIPERPVKGVLIVNDWDKASELFTSQEDGPGRGKLFQLLPTSMERGVEKSKGGDICKLLIESKWGGVSSLFIDTVRSFMANPGGHESSDWDFIGVDEPCPKPMWDAYARGLMDRGGSAWFCCTPITEMWINDYFIPRKLVRKDFFNGTDFKDAGSVYSDKWVITGSSYDNPHLTGEALESFKNDVSAAELETRISGRPRALSGLIHKDFDAEVHTYSRIPFGWENATTPPKNWTIRLAIDPHPKIPMTVLFAATGPTGHSYIWEEIFASLYVPDLCEVINHTLKRVSEPMCTLCDPLAWTPNPVTGLTMAASFQQAGVMVTPGSKELMYGILKTGELFRSHGKDKEPMLQIHENCTNLLFELDRYVWAKKDKESPAIDLPDHSIECLHRLVLAGLTWINPIDARPTQQRYDFDTFSTDIPEYRGYLVDDSKKKKAAYYHKREGYSPDWEVRAPQVYVNPNSIR